MDPKYGLYEAKLSIETFGYPTVIEFNFRGNADSNLILYGFGFQIWNIDSITAEKLYDRIGDFYTEQFGLCTGERESFEYFYEYCKWQAPTLTYGVVKNVYSTDKAYIGWGN